MNLSVSLLYHDRPHLLRQTVEAIQNCHGVERWRIVSGRQHPQLDALVPQPQYELVGGGMPDPYQRISHAMRHLLGIAFDHRGSDFNLHVDEDILLSGDALLYVEQMAHQYRDDPSVFTVTAFRNSNPEAYDVMGEGLFRNYERSASALSSNIGRHAGFVPWAWGTWADRWQEMEASWNFDAWDAGVDEMRKSLCGDCHHEAVRHSEWAAVPACSRCACYGLRERVAIYPLLSRAQNIGTEGGATPGGMAARAAAVATENGVVEWRHREHTYTDPSL